MSAKVYPILIVLAFLSLAILPFTIHPSTHKSNDSRFLGTTANARDLIRQLEATDE